MNRREFLSASILSGASVAFTGLSFPKLAMGQTTLNQTALNNIHVSMSSSLTRIANGVAVQSDYQSISTQMLSLVSELQSANFDTGIKEQFTTVNNNPGDTDDLVANMTPSKLAVLAQGALNPYAPNYSLANLQTGFASLPQFFIPPGLPESMQGTWVQQNVEAGIKVVAQNGATEWLTDGANAIAEYTSRDGICQTLSEVLWFLSFIATELAIMCVLPEPALVVICPAAGIFAIIVAIIDLLMPIVCEA